MLPKPITRRHGVSSKSTSLTLSSVASRALDPPRTSPSARRWFRQRNTRTCATKLQEHGQDDRSRVGASENISRVLFQGSRTSQCGHQSASQPRGSFMHNPLLSQVLGQPPRPQVTLQHCRTYNIENSHSVRAYGVVNPPPEEKSEQDNYMVEDEPEGIELPLNQIYTDPVVFSPRYRNIMRAVYILNAAETMYQSSAHTEKLIKWAADHKPLDQLPFLDRWWIQVSAKFGAKWDTRMPPQLREQRLDVNASTKQTVNCLLRDGTDYEAIRNVWQSEIRIRLSPEAKRLIFCECLLWILKYKPDLSLNYIQAMGQGTKAMSYILADAFEFLMDHYMERKQPLPPRFHSVLNGFLRQVPRLGTVISQKLVHGVLVNSSLDQARVFWRTVSECSFRPSSPTCVAAAHILGLLGDYKMAIKLLNSALKRNMPTDSPAVLRVSRSILRRSAIKAGGHGAGLETLQAYAEMGIPMDLHFFTIFIHNCMEAGDVRTALRFYDRIRENGMEPNDYTYTIVLSGLKRAQSEDLAAMRVVLVHAVDALPNLERPHYVATEILHHIYLRFFKFQTMDDGRKFMIANKKAFSAVVQSYCEYFDPEPLRYFGVPEEFLTSAAPQKAIETTAPPLRLTIGAYLHYVAYTDPEELPQLFDSFVEKLRRRDNPQMAQLVAENHVYNAFLMALCENESTLGKIPEVLVHMVDKQFHSKPMTSKHTWNILITGFMRHKQLAAVQRVMMIMDDLGEEPNEVTWNSLVQGWLRNEELERAIDAMKKMERTRMKLDEKTLREISFSRKGPKIMEAMERDDEDYLVPEDSDGPNVEGSTEVLQDTEAGKMPRSLIKRVYTDGTSKRRVEPQALDSWSRR